jgi:hypothetical protein
MVSAIQSGHQLSASNAAQDFKQHPLGKRFSLSTTTQTEKSSTFKPFGADGLTFLDAIDIVNPLQHLPVIGPLYREITGDTLDPVPRIAGSTLFLGPFGTAVSAVNLALEEFTGNDMGSHLIAMIKEKDKNAAQATSANTEIANLPITQNKTYSTVTTWAAGEINHRNGQALIQGINLPTRTYSTLVVNAAPALDETAKAIVPFLEPNKAEPIDKPTQQHRHQAATGMPIQHGLLSLNTFKKGFQAPSISLLQIKRSTDAYQSVSQTKSERIDRQPVTDTIARTAPAISTPSKPQVLGATALYRGWFSTSMNDAPSQYHHADSSGLLLDKNNVPLATSLH